MERSIIMMEDISVVRKNNSAYINAAKSQEAAENGKNFVFDGAGNGVVNTQVDETVVLIADGDDIVFAESDKNEIKANSGANKITVKGNENYVRGGKDSDDIETTGNSNNINGGAGNDKMKTFGNNNVTSGNDGNDDLLVIGNGNILNSGEGNNSVVLEGDDIEYHLGNGDNYFSTLDYAIRNQDSNSPFDYNQYAYALADYITNGIDSTKIGTLYDYEVTNVSTPTAVDENGVSRTIYQGDTVTQDIKDLLADGDKAIVDNYDFNDTYTDGSAKYIIAQGDLDGTYHIYENKGNGTYYAVRGWSAVGNGNGYLYLTKTSTTETTEYTTQKTTSDVYSEANKYTISGVKNLHGTVGTGSNNMTLNVSDLVMNGESVDIDEEGNYVNNSANSNLNSENNIFVSGSIKVVDEYSRHTVYKNAETSTLTSTSTETKTISSYFTQDPIVLDFNRDGKVSYIEGSGVDINNDGIADGAATGGDKMLAMSDIDGNETINGAEIFGNNTISPFTKQALNAENGFEALAMIAKEAEDRGYECMDDEGNVDLQALNNALRTVAGVSLGFISDDNTSTVEDLAHVASINVGVYSGRNVETGEIQVGTYTDNTGKKYSAFEVWGHTS
jgi:hypothetical protein